MGLFDLFASKETRAQGALQKLTQKLTQKYGPPENRAKAIDQLHDLGTPEALQALCMRFTILADPTITDADEKQRVFQLLAEEGEQAVVPVERFIHEQESGVAWGLRILAAVLPAERLQPIVLGELSHLGRVYSRDPEKKLTLLTWLREHIAGADSAGEAVAEAVLPLLEDFSDDVRIAATRALAALARSERTRDALVGLLLRDRENLRVRGEVFEALAELGADVKGHRPDVEALIAEPFFLDREGHVKKRG
ncbi:MAG: HEAT repeat domain-containing protein [Anaeromyxobacteraceae bacterium]